MGQASPEGRSMVTVATVHTKKAIKSLSVHPLLLMCVLITALELCVYTLQPSARAMYVVAIKF